MHSRNNVGFDRNVPAMMFVFRPLRLLSWTGAALLAAVPAMAQTPALAMLSGLDRGQWQLIDRDNGGAPVRSLCLGDATMLLQLRHEGAACQRFVIEDTPTAVTVQYRCTGTGNGRTTVRRETARLVQIDTQGIFNGAPFSYAYEARRTGVCR